MNELPLFPLNAVLFPGMPLALHIFEPRYRVMITQCIEQSAPFGVVLIREGAEVGDIAVPYGVGTSAYITQVEHLSDGRMNIQAVGYQRFRIKSLRHDRPYLVGLVESFPVQGGDMVEVQAVSHALSVDLQNYINSLSSLLSMDQRIQKMPDDSEALAFLTAIVLQTSMKEKQILLEIPDLLSMLRAGQRLLEREARLLEHMIWEESRQRGGPTSFSVN